MHAEAAKNINTNINKNIYINIYNYKDRNRLNVVFSVHVQAF